MPITEGQAPPVSTRPAAGVAIRPTAAAASPRIQRGCPHNAKRAQPYRFCGGTVAEHRQCIFSGGKKALRRLKWICLGPPKKTAQQIA